MTDTPPRSEPRTLPAPQDCDALRAAAGRILAITVQETLPEALRQELQDVAIKIRALASSPPPCPKCGEPMTGGRCWRHE
jgi:hypothetical protein